jgi:hypothetical protein
MHRKLKSLALVAAMAMTGLGAECFSITDPFVVSVNLQDVSDTLDITPGATDFDPGCRTINPADYLGQSYDLVSGARLVDVKVQTIGQFGGTVSGAEVRVNDVELLSFSGTWNAFNTEQSLLSNSSLLSLNPAGVTTLETAIENRLPLTVCHAGAFSEPTPAGLRVVVTVFAQVDATP